MDIELLKAVVEQIKEDADNKDFTAIECLFPSHDRYSVESGGYPAVARFIVVIRMHQHINPLACIELRPVLHRIE